METKETKKKFFYGWCIIAMLFLINVVVVTFISGFWSYYQVPISTDLGVDYVQFNVSNMSSTIAGILFGIVAASRITKGNTRLFMLLGGLLAAAFLVLQSFTTQIWQLWITFALVNFSLNAVTYTPMNYIISRWFIDKKGLVTSIVFMGGGVGGTLFATFFAGMLAEYGWRYCHRFVAVAVAVMVVLAFLIVRKSPEEMGLEPYRKAGSDKQDAPASAATASEVVLPGVTKAEAMKLPSFWLYCLSVVCCGMVAAGIMTQLPTALIEGGFNYAPVMATYSFCAIFAQLIMGTLYDKIGLVKGLFINAAFGIVALVILLFVGKIGVTAAFIAAGLLSFGGVVSTLVPPLLARTCFGLKDFGGIYGLGYSFFMVGCMVGPILSAAIRTAIGAYSIAWIVYIAIYALLALSAMISIKTSPVK